jgi:hypothetical protein
MRGAEMKKEADFCAIVLRFHGGGSVNALILI